MGSLLVITTVNASDFKENDSAPALPASYDAINNTVNNNVEQVN